MGEGGDGDPVVGNGVLGDRVVRVGAGVETARVISIG